MISVLMIWLYGLSISFSMGHPRAHVFYSNSFICTGEPVPGWRSQRTGLPSCCNQSRISLRTGMLTFQVALTCTWKRYQTWESSQCLISAFVVSKERWAVIAAFWSCHRLIHICICPWSCILIYMPTYWRAFCKF